jgi:pseudouridine-5'-phosphate glycosidase
MGGTGWRRTLWDGVRIAPRILAALEDGASVVALESALITHGFAQPVNLAIARRMATAAREADALPAFVAVMEGEAWVGLSDDELARLAAESDAQKISIRDLPTALARGVTGGTTVAASLQLAYRAGLQVFATGGIGGVHRGHSEDVSADLPALSRLPLVVVCAGAKAILDLPRTLEYLETWGVPVIGYGTDEFPAFYSRHSGLPVDACADTPEEIVQIAAARTRLGLDSALLICVPPPASEALDPRDARRAVARALQEAEEAGIRGTQLTPFLLARVVDLTDGQARRANEALLANNVRVAADIAGALAASRWTG